MGVDQNQKKAIELLRSASQKGHRKSMVKLAELQSGRID
jgi:TPR repeat protein